MTIACREVPSIDVGSSTQDESLQEKMIGANRLIAQSEEQQIASYVSRRGWQMQRTADGVRVMETSCPLSADRVEYADTVVTVYNVEALNGKQIYRNVADTLTVGRRRPTRGFDSALLLLHYGGTARVIVPSEQAYGVVGDGGNIGSRMVLVYEIGKIKML